MVLGIVVSLLAAPMPIRFVQIREAGVALDQRPPSESSEAPGITGSAASLSQVTQDAAWSDILAQAALGTRYAQRRLRSLPNIDPTLSTGTLPGAQAVPMLSCAPI